MSMAEWQPYQPCCYAAALQPDSSFCGECGRPLFRCAAFDQCRGLVNPLGYCGICLLPRLTVEEGAVLKARAEEVLSIPFRLANRSSAGRSFQVLFVFKDELDVYDEPVRLNWERIGAGQERAFSVNTQPLSRGGVHRLRLTFVLASCANGFEEHYAFSGEIALRVEGGGPTQVVQHFDLSNSDFGTAGMVVANPSIREPSDASGPVVAKRIEVPLERAERYEMEGGYRGYAKTGIRVARNTDFEFIGFPVKDRPRGGPLCTPLAVLRCGRNSRRHDPVRNPYPNDLCLRAYDPATGELNVSASQAIARHVGDFLIQNNRLYFRSRGDNRVAQNGDPLHAAELRVVDDGDVFALPAVQGAAFTVSLRFGIASGIVERIVFERSPPIGRG
jgi:hypothetical protein